jgi:hypothetical protein
MKIRVVFFITILICLFLFSSRVIASGNGSQSIDSLQENVTTSKQLEPINKRLKEIQLTLTKISDKNDFPWEAFIALALGIFSILNIPGIVKRRLFKPKLEVRLKLEPPDCLKIAMTNKVTGQFLYDTYYFRFMVRNIGNRKMEDVEVVALELYKNGANNVFSQVKSFLPMNLVWANMHKVTMPKIQPGLFKHCDLGHIIQCPNPHNGVNNTLQRFNLATRSNVVFILETNVTPNTGSNYLLPGEYKIKLAFAANNLEPEYYWYMFQVEDRWDTDEQRMLSNNIVIEEIL